MELINKYYKQGPGTCGGSTQYRIVRPSSRSYLADYGEWFVADNYVCNYPEVTAITGGVAFSLTTIHPLSGIPSDWMNRPLFN